MSWHEIRPIAIGLLTRDDAVLVADVSAHSDDERGYRPLGGAIEYGETSEEALRREFREELGVDLATADLLDVCENLFTVDGELGHEHVFVYHVTLAASFDSIYEADSVRAEDNGEQFQAEWVSTAAFESEDLHLYPPGIVPLLASLAH